MGVVGEYDEFLVENLSFLYDRKLLVSCLYDQIVKFWKVDNFKKEKVNIKKKVKKINKFKYLVLKDDFFVGLVEGEFLLKIEKNDEDDDNDDSDDDE